MMGRHRTIAALVCLLALPLASGAVFPDTPEQAARDEIVSLPGYNGTFRSRQYGGYVTVGRKHGRHLYYYLSEAVSDPATAPLVIWLNGGPGCSSFDGLVLEHGPFTVKFVGGKDADGARPQKWYLEDNPWAWSGAASVLYVDSPAGVGMSYSETPRDYSTGDNRTIADLGRFVARFLDRHPRFRDVSLFLAGESYAGVYVPLLAREILRRGGRDRDDLGRSLAAARSAARQLKGYMVGNPVTDLVVDGMSFVTFAADQSLIPQSLHASALVACGNRSGPGASLRHGGACHRELGYVNELLQGINKYGILEPCYQGRNPYKVERPTAAFGGNANDGGEEGGDEGGARPRAGGRPAVVDPPAAQLAATLARLEAAMGPAARAARLGHTPGCLDSREMWAFANDPAVRRAIHAAPASSIGAFDECTNGDRIRYEIQGTSVLDVHAELLDRGVAVLAYSGDHDAIVSHVGTEAWTARLGGRPAVPWSQWRLDDGTVAGYYVAYERGITYATVLAAGHAVPVTKPAAAYQLFSRFLESGSPGRRANAAAVAATGADLVVASR